MKHINKYIPSLLIIFFVFQTSVILSMTQVGKGIGRRLPTTMESIPASGRPLIKNPQSSLRVSPRQDSVSKQVCSVVKQVTEKLALPNPTQASTFIDKPFGESVKDSTVRPSSATTTEKARAVQGVLNNTSLGSLLRLGGTRSSLSSSSSLASVNEEGSAISLETAMEIVNMCQKPPDTPILSKGLLENEPNPPSQMVNQLMNTYSVIDSDSTLPNQWGENSDAVPQQTIEEPLSTNIEGTGGNQLDQDLQLEIAPKQTLSTPEQEYVEAPLQQIPISARKTSLDQQIQKIEKELANEQEDLTTQTEELSILQNSAQQKQKDFNELKLQQETEKRALEQIEMRAQELNKQLEYQQKELELDAQQKGLLEKESALLRELENIKQQEEAAASKVNANTVSIQEKASELSNLETQKKLADTALTLTRAQEAQAQKKVEATRKRELALEQTRKDLREKTDVARKKAGRLQTQTERAQQKARQRQESKEKEDQINRVNRAPLAEQIPLEQKRLAENNESKEPSQAEQSEIPPALEGPFVTQKSLLPKNLNPQRDVMQSTPKKSIIDLAGRANVDAESKEIYPAQEPPLVTQDVVPPKGVVVPELPNSPVPIGLADIFPKSPSLPELPEMNNVPLAAPVTLPPVLSKNVVQKDIVLPESKKSVTDMVSKEPAFINSYEPVSPVASIIPSKNGTSVLQETVNEAPEARKTVADVVPKNPTQKDEEIIPEKDELTAAASSKPVLPEDNAIREILKLRPTSQPVPKQTTSKRDTQLIKNRPVEVIAQTPAEAPVIAKPRSRVNRSALPEFPNLSGSDDTGSADSDAQQNTKVSNRGNGKSVQISTNNKEFPKEFPYQYPYFPSNINYLSSPSNTYAPSNNTVADLSLEEVNADQNSIEESQNANEISQSGQPDSREDTFGFPPNNTVEDYSALSPISVPSPSSNSFRDRAQAPVNTAQQRLNTTRVPFKNRGRSDGVYPSTNNARPDRRQSWQGSSSGSSSSLSNNLSKKTPTKKPHKEKEPVSNPLVRYTIAALLLGALLGLGRLGWVFIRRII